MTRLRAPRFGAAGSGLRAPRFGAAGPEDPLAEPETPSINVTEWVLRISAGTIFVGVGVLKLWPGPESMWVKLFDEIGIGQWFRVLTGLMQVCGGLLLLVPRTAQVGAVVAGCTMAGAIVVHTFVLDTGIPGAVIPAALLVFLSIVARVTSS